jgi:hypothetical protein
MDFGNINTNIIKSGLVFNMDAANRASTIPSTSTDKTFNTINSSQSGSFNSTGIFDSSTITPSFAFDGGTEIINCNTISVGFGPALGYGTATSAFSVSAWAKANDWSNTYLFGNRGSGTGDNDTGFAFSTYAATSFAGLFFRVGNGTNPSAAFNYSGLQTNTWTHFVFVYDGSGSTNADKVKFYKDNSPLSLTFSTTMPTTVTSTLDFALGAYTYDGGRTNAWNGNIGPCQVYNRALSANEVLHNYNALKGRFGL